MDSKIIISDVVKASWGYLKSQIWVLVGLFTAYLIIYGILTGIAQSIGGAGLIVQLVSAVFAVFFFLGYYKNIFQVLDGVEPQFSAYGQQASKFVTAFFTSLLVGIIVLLGCVFLIIPGIYLAIRLEFTIQAIIEEDAGIIESMQRSWDITRGHVMNLFLLLLVMFLILVVGALALGIGILVAAPLVYVISCYVYRLLAGNSVSNQLES